MRQKPIQTGFLKGGGDISWYTVTEKCFGGSGQACMAVSRGNQVSCSGSLLPSFLSQLIPSMCQLHSRLLRLIFSPVIKEDDCWQPQLHPSLAPRLRQKAAPADESLQDSDWLSLGHVHIPEPITATRASLHQCLAPWRGRVQGTTVWYLPDHTVCERDGSPKERAVCTQTISDHHGYSSCLLLLDIKEAHLGPINSLGAKILGPQGSIWQCFQCSWALGILPEDAKSSEACGITKWVSDDKPPRLRLIVAL